MQALNSDIEAEIVKSLSVLRSGGVILYPTDTIWGIGCDATDDQAVEKIFRIKNRPEKKSMIVLIASSRDILKYVAAPPPEIWDLIENTSTPLTIIFPGGIGLAPRLIDEEGNVAIRVVQDEFCRHLIKRLRKPLVSTSANISGKPFPESFAQIDREIIDNVDYAVNFRREDTEKKKPSKIIRLEKSGKITVIRE